MKAASPSPDDGSAQVDGPRKQVVATTDGSCETATGEGGWAYHLAFGRHERTASGYETGTTNNRMELTAAVRALEALVEPCHVTLVTDSQYLKKAFTDGWLASWRRNGWRTAARQPVKNRDLWQRLLELADVHDLHWRWTKGHAGHATNELVDALALRARRERRGTAHG
ncbi:MAG: ribonuclease HI [Trueperaceae bacterium]|nr:ribonuclease HI [Trueperaceae bacterium]